MFLHTPTPHQGTDSKAAASGIFPAASSPLFRQALEATEALASGFRVKGLDQMDALMGVVFAQQERHGVVDASLRRHPHDNTMRVDVGQRHALVQSIVNAPMPGAWCLVLRRNTAVDVL